ncbi:MAG: CPBP family intramembrane metalloprotease [Candidatus Marinimicrobia bacterium]|nr:CPBP family intramembrane metalloprotease [Candidatus Neomarinimicrobiota bacterium]
MNRTVAFSAQDKFSLLSIVPFLIITFLIAWSILGAYIFNQTGMENMFGQLSGNHPLFFLSVWAPAIAAFTIIGIRSGFTGVKKFMTSVRLWRCSTPWYLLMFVVIPVVFYMGAALRGTLFTDPLPVSGAIPMLSALLLAAIKGPVEEFGWRGFALPVMQRTFTPFWAGIILGIIWGLWHLPAFYISGTQQSAWVFTPFFIGTITISILATALFNASRGSILLPAILHFQLMNPIWPDAQPYDTYLLLVIAAVVVWINRKTMFTRNGAVTDVVPQRDSQTV